MSLIQARASLLTGRLSLPRQALARAVDPPRRPARRHLVAWLVALCTAVWLAGLALPVAAATPPVAPKVAIIVGPAGPGITDRYRAAAEAAARIARRITPNVVRVYSPGATWQAVRAAVTGASVVVYLGHGNGWPSRYSDVLQERSQNGFGLNPVAGGDDAAHQYYGEAFVERLHLAPNAVVLLNHLCYASGNTEPGLPEGSITQALGRADGFASGFIRAGARVVVAEGHSDPAALIEAAISGPTALARAWRAAEWGHGHMQNYPSTRTAGARVALDPDRPAGGFYRSLVEVGSNSPRVVGDGAGAPPPGPTSPPSLVASGIRFGGTTLAGQVAPGGRASLRLAVTTSASRLPAALAVGLRWMPLSTMEAEPGAAATDPGLTVGEAAGDLVETAATRRSGNTLVASTTVPTRPGTYLVLATLETADGLPYDVATQAMLRPFIAVVPKAIGVALQAPAAMDAGASTVMSVTVLATNTGTQAWGSSLYASLWDDPAAAPWLDRYLGSILAVDAAWMDPATGNAWAAASYPLPRRLGAPGQRATVDLAVRTPDLPGHYVLVLAFAVRGSLGEFPAASLAVQVEVH